VRGTQTKNAKTFTLNSLHPQVNQSQAPAAQYLSSESNVFLARNSKIANLAANNPYHADFLRLSVSPSLR